MDKFTSLLAKEFSRREEHIENILRLLDEGNTVPFIARYRKEMHGTTDDQTIRAIADRLAYLRGLDERKAAVVSAIEAQGKLTDELSAAIENAQTLAEVEDIYRPYKQKRRTRATIAREKGLAPLAELLLSQMVTSGTLEALAAPYVNEEKGVMSTDDALAGAGDIIAETILDDAAIRAALRRLYRTRGVLWAKAATDEDSVYRLYYDYREPVSKVQGHRVLAVNRGEREGMLKAGVEIEDALALQKIRRAVFRGISISNAFVNACCEDAWRRLIEPSAEREIRGELTDAADEAAIRAFGQNLQPLLMQPPLRNRVTMGFDPAYRTGCKIAVVDETGKVLETGVVYPTPPHNRKDEARKTLTAMIRRHGVTAIAIGNGTASKESEIFIADMIRDLPGVAYMVVNEAGASVYSASKLGAEEFPDYDVSLRSAVSIARRLQDPLAELVKIEPKSIGVGQYQHDMPPARLDETLRGVVEDCVNSVGADLNTASAPLLSYVAGLNDTAAKNIVAYREANGAYPSRAALKKVPRIGPKTFEQCAGFLRVTQGKNVLDATGVHPESYAAAEKLLALCGYTEADVRAHRVGELRERVKALGEEKAAAHCGVGVPTLSDIVSDLMKPGRDPRDELPAPLLRTDILELKDLKPGMKLRGTVRNVVDFGAFVDIGVHQDGLVHISRLSDNFVRKPSDVVRVGDVVDVAVVEVDAAKKRIALSMLAADVGRN
ncbi:MAG: RNA-binding transcriptional accessory protein [Firmicutes bacterium]|nr:RNA-binding transcriptional accessory protein [Bacillota bacterium]